MAPSMLISLGDGKPIVSPYQKIPFGPRIIPYHVDFVLTWAVFYGFFRQLMACDDAQDYTGLYKIISSSINRPLAHCIPIFLTVKSFIQRL